MNELVKDLDRYKIDLCALQDIRWPGKGTVVKKKYVILCGGHKNDKREFGKGYYISRHIMDNLLGFEPTNEIIFKLSVKLKYYNLTLMLAHTLTEE